MAVAKAIVRRSGILAHDDIVFSLSPHVDSSVLPHPVLQGLR
jgi:hypothetical protein